MMDKICQMYREEQTNKTRNGRKLVPDNKMPNLHWNLEKQETVHKEEIQETQEINRLNSKQEVITYIIIFIYSCILQIQDTIFQYANSAIEMTQNAIGTIKEISHSSWIIIQKEVQAKQEHLCTCRKNFKNQLYRPRNGHSENIPNQ